MSTVTTIKRGGLTAAIDSMGAQLTSLALNGNEYLWQGDPAFWGKHAPILFPIVGSLRNNTATSAAGTCEMARHGIARIVEHKPVEVSEDGSSVTYEITDTPESLKAFPFHFKLNMTYALTGDATLTQTFAVTNTGDVDLQDVAATWPCRSRWAATPRLTYRLPVPRTRRSRITSWRLPRFGLTRPPSSRPTVL